MTPGVTLTGLGPSAPLHEVLALGEQYANVEYGLLVSKSRAGLEGRYPSLDYVAETAKVLDTQAIDVAVHICGSAVQQFISGDAEILRLTEHASRVQLNFNVGRTPIAPEDLVAAIERFGRPVITQHNAANSEFSQQVKTYLHRVLFDASGGEGIRVDAWPAPIPRKLCGYAGGIGPETVEEDIKKAEIASQGLPYWIDMESSLRSDDRFDLGKCRVVLEKVQSVFSRAPAPK